MGEPFDQEFLRVWGSILTRTCQQGKKTPSSSHPPSDPSQPDWKISIHEVLNMVKTQYAFEKKDLPSVNDLKNDKELGKIVEEQLKKFQAMYQSTDQMNSKGGCRDVMPVVMEV